MLEAVIFDMDGVIIDSEPMHFEVVKKMMEEFDINITSEQLNRYIGTSNPGMWNDLKKRFGIKKNIPDLLKQQYQLNIDMLGEYNEGAIPGVVELLKKLQKNKIKTAVASSSTPDYINAVVDKFKIRQYFSYILSGEQVEKGKPEPDIFLKAAQMLNVSPDFCVVIEDSEHGVAAAKRGGMKCIGFTNPNSGQQDLSKADLICEDLRNLNLEILKNLLENL